MDDESATAAIRSSGPRPTQWPEEARELAYQLWAFDCGRDAPRVAEKIAVDYAIPDRTIRDWVTRFAWSERADREIASIAPAILRQSLTELIAGSIDASRYLRDVARGNDPSPNKVRVAAALGILDRVGIGPRRIDGDVTTQLPATTDMSSDGPIDTSPQAAAERIRQRREGWKG